MLTTILSYQRYAVFVAAGLMTLASLAGAMVYSEWLFIVAVVSGALFFLGIHDLW